MTSVAGRIVLLVGLGGFIILLDRITKMMVLSSLSQGEFWSIGFGIHIVHTYNTGIAFGLASQLDRWHIVISSAVVIFLVWWMIHHPWKWRIPITIIIAGAVGNIIDRILYGAVLDFISIGRFPVFNVADTAITIGGCLLVLLMIRKH